MLTLLLLYCFQLDTLRLPEVTIYSNHLKDAQLLARLIHSEAGNQCEEGKIAVGNVVLNRMNYFDRTLEDVIFENRQFCGVRTRAFLRPPSEEDYNIAIRVLSGETIIGPSVLYFANQKTASNRAWLRALKLFKAGPPFKIDNHTFYHDPDAWIDYNAPIFRHAGRKIIP